MMAHLRRRIVLDSGISKKPSFHVVDLHLQRERFILLQGRIVIVRKDELARRLLVLGSNTTHLLRTLVEER